jgi:hypothetical protein
MSRIKSPLRLAPTYCTSHHNLSHNPTVTSFYCSGCRLLVTLVVDGGTTVNSFVLLVNSYRWRRGNVRCAASPGSRWACTCKVPTSASACVITVVIYLPARRTFATTSSHRSLLLINEYRKGGILLFLINILCYFLSARLAYKS